MCIIIIECAACLGIGVLPCVCCVLQGAVSGSVQASDRLMKELREIYRSQSYKMGTYFTAAALEGSSDMLQ